MLIGFNIILAVSLQLINGFSGQFSLGHAGFMAVGRVPGGVSGAVALAQDFTNPASRRCWFYVALLIVVA